MSPCDNLEIVFLYPYLEKRNHSSSVYISITVISDTSIERSSRVVASCSMETRKFDFLFKKGNNFILTYAEVLKYP